MPISFLVWKAVIAAIQGKGIKIERLIFELRPEETPTLEPEREMNFSQLEKTLSRNRRVLVEQPTKSLLQLKTLRGQQLVDFLNYVFKVGGVFVSDEKTNLREI